jgi:hypothetical protein
MSVFDESETCVGCKKWSPIQRDVKTNSFFLFKYRERAGKRQSAGDPCSMVDPVMPVTRNTIVHGAMLFCYMFHIFSVVSNQRNERRPAASLARSKNLEPGTAMKATSLLSMPLLFSVSSRYTRPSILQHRRLKRHHAILTRSIALRRIQSLV